MNTFNIGNYLNPHLSLIYTDYYDKQIELYIIDMIYHFLNNDNIKHNKKLLNKNIRFKLTVDELPKINDIIELNNDELSKINELIDNYKNELERVNEIYNLFKKFDFNFINKYKDVHLSGLINSLILQNDVILRNLLNHIKVLLRKNLKINLIGKK